MQRNIDFSTRLTHWLHTTKKKIRKGLGYQGRSPSGFWSGSRSGCNANQCIQMVLQNFIQVYRVLYCRSALHMVGVGNQASSPSSKNTLRTICTSTKVEFFLLVPGHPGTTPSYAPGYIKRYFEVCTTKLYRKE